MAASSTHSSSRPAATRVMLCALRSLPPLPSPLLLGPEQHLHGEYALNASADAWGTVLRVDELSVHTLKEKRAMAVQQWAEAQLEDIASVLALDKERRAAGKGGAKKK